MVADFRSLDVWKAARSLRNDVFAWCDGLPGDERFRLRDQMIRASRSITANIAEGHGRFSHREAVRYAHQARGSLSELMDHLDVARGCGYMNSDELEAWLERTQNLARLLNGYIRFLRGRASSGPD